MFNVKKYIVLLLFLPEVLAAQELKELDLQQAYDLAQKNYPAIKQKDLVRKAADLTIDNLSKGYLPQIQFNGQATYQSDVTSIKGSIIPGVNIQSPDNDQYKITADLNQVIFDGGVIKQEKISRLLNATVEEQRVEVELYGIRDKINQLYFGILYLDEQIKQVELIKNDINTGIKTVEAQVNNGVAFKSHLNVLKAELLKTDQRNVELKASRKGFVDALALFLNQPLNDNIILEQPIVQNNQETAEIRRPELKLFENQSQLFDHQNKMIQSRMLPKASVFAQGGYGKPGLNLLDNTFKFYYIGGLRLNWSLSNLYTQKKEKELVKVNQQSVDVQKETFLLNTNAQLKQQQAEIDKLQQLIASDNEIIDLRKNVTVAAKAQLENSVITPNDFLKEVNAEDQARQTQITHRVQLLQAQINYQTISGKF